MIDFSKVIHAMKELPPLRFLAIWLWLVLLAAAPVLFGIAKIVAATKGYK